MHWGKHVLNALNIICTWQAKWWTIWVCLFEALYIKLSHVLDNSVHVLFPAASHFVTSSIIHLHFVHSQNCKVLLFFPRKVQRLINNEICCQLFFMIGYQFYQLLQANYFYTYWTSFLMTVESFITK